MNQKGALELSVNAIVILIIALAILGLVIGFAVNKFNELGAQIVPTENTAEATPQNTITLPGGKQRFSVAVRGGLLMEAGVYTTTEFTQGGALDDTQADISCAVTEDAFTVDANCPVLEAGESGKCSVSISSSSAEVGTEYACTLTLLGQSKTVFLTAQ